MALVRSLLCLVIAAAQAQATIDTTRPFDYIIIGGGVGGLTVANRLSEDGHKNVLVLEAGSAHLNDPKILIPGMLGGTLGDPDYDWNFSTVPQPFAANRSVPWSRGKVWGGSSAVNFMAFGRPAAGEIDAFGKLGNPGWSWSNLFKYIKKSETFTPPPATEAAEFNLTYVPSAHGYNGPLTNSFVKFISPAQKPWLAGLASLGVPTIKDGLGGNDVGAWLAPAAVDAASQTRSYATSAYYLPAANRTNLVVMGGAQVTRLITNTMHGSVAATGVEYVSDGKTLSISVKAGGEVILSAGAIKSPQILELSGIGDPKIIQPLGINVVVDLPGVGANIIDHIFLGASYQLKNDSVATLDSLRDPATAAAALAEYQTNKTGLFTTGVSGYCLVPLQTLVGNAVANTMIDAQALKIQHSNATAAQKERANVIINQLRQPKDYGLVEAVIFPGFFTTASAPAAGKKYITFTADLHFPFSTGSIHIASTNGTVQPAIDPGYFTEEFDLEVLLQTLKFLRKLAATPAFKDSIAAEADPGAAVATDDQLREYIRNYVGTEYHTVGSAAMLPRAKGGVVSPELKVYGTSNIRVVDLSILPLQISAHPQSTMYGIAEKASDIIRGKITV